MRTLLAAALLAAGFLMGGPAAADESHTMVEKAWARATPPTAKAGAAYVTLHSKSGDALTAAASPVAERVELHTHLMQDGIMKMTHVERVDVPKDVMVKMEPGGLHIMLMGLKEPLVEGAMVPLTLTFEHAGTVEVMAHVMAIGAKGMDHGGHDHSGHGQGSSDQ